MNFFTGFRHIGFKGTIAFASKHNNLYSMYFIETTENWEMFFSNFEKGTGTSKQINEYHCLKRICVTPSRPKWSFSKKWDPGIYYLNHETQCNVGQANFKCSCT